MLRSNQDLQQFAFAASHDLQEPLRTISVFAQLIEQEMQSTLTDRQKSYFDRVADGTKRMQVLIHDLLAYSQVGREDRPPELVDVEKAVSAAISNLRQQLDSTGCQIIAAPAWLSPCAEESSKDTAAACGSTPLPVKGRRSA